MLKIKVAYPPLTPYACCRSVIFVFWAHQSEMSDAELNIDATGHGGTQRSMTGSGGVANAGVTRSGIEDDGQTAQPQTNRITGAPYPSAPWGQRSSLAADTSDLSSSQRSLPQPPTEADPKWPTPPSSPPFQAVSQQQQQQRLPDRSSEFQPWGGGDSTFASTFPPHAPEQSQGLQEGSFDASGSRPPIWGIDSGRQSIEQLPEQFPTDKDAPWGIKAGQQQQFPAANDVASSAATTQTWEQGQPAEGNDSLGAEGLGAPAGTSTMPTDSSGSDCGSWGAAEGLAAEQGQEKGSGSGASKFIADPWLGGGREQTQTQDRAGQEQGVPRAEVGAGTNGGLAPSGEGASSHWSEQERPIPYPASYVQQQPQVRESPQGSFNGASPSQQRQQQMEPMYQRSNKPESWGTDAEPRGPGRTSHGEQGQHPRLSRGPQNGPPQDWERASSPPSMDHGQDSDWRASASQGPGAKEYEPPPGWVEARYAGQGQPRMGEQGQQHEGYYEQDGGYYQGPQGRDQWDSRENVRVKEPSRFFGFRR